MAPPGACLTFTRSQAGAMPMQSILRGDRRGVSPVVAEILLVAIAVALTAVLYIMATGLLSGPTGTSPLLAFSPVDPFSGGDYNVTFSIASTTSAVPPGNYRFNLQVNGAVGVAKPLGASGVGVNITVGGVAYRVVWVDTGNDGTVNDGDRFLVTGNGVSLPPASRFVFYLLWSDGSLIQQQVWQTP